MNARDFLPHITTTSTALAPLRKEHRDRQELYSLYWRYYRGHHRKPIKQREGQADDNVIINWSRKIVNTGVAFLFGGDVQFQLDEMPERSPEEQYLDWVWGDDAARKFVKGAFLQSVAQNGAVCGTAFVRLYPPTAPGEKPTLRNIDPALVDVITSADDVDDVTAYHIVWKAGDVWRRHRFERADNGLMWFIFEEEKTAADRNWRVVDELAWEYDFPPIFHCQNMILANSQWGASDLEDADLNDAINFVASNTNRIVRFHAHPKTVGTGFQSSQLSSTAVDGFWTISNEAARVYNLEMDSDLQSSRQHKQDLEDAYHQVASVPRLDPAQVNVGALSGFALRILYGPLLQKTAVKQLTYGGMLAQINRALLVLGGYSGDTDVTCKFANPLPMSELEQADYLLKLVEAGVSLDAAAKVARFSDADVRVMTESASMFEIPAV